MATVKPSPAETVERLQRVETLLDEGCLLADALRGVKMTEAAYHKGRTEYGGLLRTLGPALGKTRRGPLTR